MRIKIATNIAASRAFLSKLLPHFLFDAMNHHLKDLINKLLWLMCPIALGESFDDYSSSILLFPSSNPKHITVWIFIYSFYAVHIVDGFFYPFIDTHFLPLPRESLGPLLSQIHLMAGSICCEFVFVRSYFLYFKLRYGQVQNSWVDLVAKITKKNRPALFEFLRIFFPLMYVVIVTVYVANQMIKLVFERSTICDYLFNVTWMLGETFLLRFTLLELPLLYIMAFSVFLYLKDTLDQVLDNFKQHQLNVHTIREYNQVIKIILDVNPLMKLISFLNGLLIIPFISLVIVFIITDTKNRLQLIVKYVYFFPCCVYSARGVMMTAVLAKIDTNSRILYKLISSRIARGQFNGPVSHRQLMFIIEDLACSRNHITLREYSGSACTQMDIMMYVFAIAQFVMLLMQFNGQFLLSSF